MPIWIAISFQDRCSPSMEQLTFFHDHTMIVLTIITVITIYIMISAIRRKQFHKFIIEGQEIETIWTVLPALLLIFIALPSLKTLYLIEDTKNPRLTIKVNGHQWYWSYEYPIVGNSEVDIFIEDSKIYRLLKTNELLYVPCMSTTRALVTSADVIHSWAIPAIGTKIDALPGRLNQTFIFPKRLGLFSGQCSEICGINHSFMPIILQSLTSEEFIKKISR